MLNSNAGLWPQMAANSPDVEGADPWGLSTVIETQARLWNHMLDANRSLWELYAPWLSAGQVWNAALAPLERDDTGEEPAQTVDGVPDALESQARTWNHLLDANRNFWNAFGLMPGAGFTGQQGNGAAAAESSEPRPAPAKRRTAPRKAARGKRAAG